MTIQSKILKLSPKTSYCVHSWGIIKTSNYTLYYIEANKEREFNYNRYWISEKLYEFLNYTFTDVVDGYRKIIYDGHTKNIIDIWLTTEDEINTFYGKKIKHYVEIYSEYDDLNGVIYANYRGCNRKGVDTTKIFHSYFIRNFV